MAKIIALKLVGAKSLSQNLYQIEFLLRISNRISSEKLHPFYSSLGMLRRLLWLTKQTSSHHSFKTRYVLFYAKHIWNHCFYLPGLNIRKCNHKLIVEKLLRLPLFNYKFRVISHFQESLPLYCETADTEVWHRSKSSLPILWKSRYTIATHLPYDTKIEVIHTFQYSMTEGEYHLLCALSKMRNYTISIFGL